MQRSGDAFTIDPSTLARNGPGTALPDKVRVKMETALGGDFSDVRIHVGPQAGSIGALAFTTGSDIYFAPGLYQPDSPRGQQLLGHELAHVLQQREGRVRNPFGGALAVVQDRALEAEADRLGHKAAALQMKPALGSVVSTPSGVAASTPAPVQAKPYKLIMGSYLHQGGGAAGLPAEAAGHSFVAFEHPSGKREAWGFSPADASAIKSIQGLRQMRAGVPGRVHRDEQALGQPGVRTRSYDLSPTEARAALAKVAEYRSRQPDFSFTNRDCGVFARDVARAAGVEVRGNAVVPPRQMHAGLGGAAPAAQRKLTGAPAVSPAHPRPQPPTMPGPPKRPGPPKA